MIKKNKKINMFKVKCGLIIVLILIIILVTIKSKNVNKELSILFNNEIIETLNKVIIDEEKNIYFSKEDIQKLFDDTIYFNEAEKELITTYNTHVALLKIDEEYGLIDDINTELKGKMQEKDKKVYIPITDLQTIYDIELNYIENNNRIVIDSLLKEKKVADVNKKTKVYEKKGFFHGNKLDNLIIRDKVVVLGEEGKYKKIRTHLGEIGYVKKNKLSEDIIIREDAKYEKQEINVYDNYSNISGIYNNISVDSSKLNVVTPTFFNIDKNSNVLDRTSISTATYSVYKNWTDSNGIQIMPALENDENISKVLLSYSQRSQVIGQLRDMLLKYNYIGINIKFNTIDDINSFYRFILELYPRFKAVGIKVAVTLNSNLDRKRIENSVDYILED